jgi:hypothetical protein
LGNRILLRELLCAAPFFAKFELSAVLRGQRKLPRELSIGETKHSFSAVAAEWLPQGSAFCHLSLLFFFFYA